MKFLNELLKELGISKVKLARYLGVSRQMVYNYLELESIEDWPKDKKIKLLLLFGVNDFKDIQNIKPTNDYIMKIDKKLNNIDSNDNLYAGEINYNVKNLNKKSQKVLANIISLLKERLAEDDKEGTNYNTFRYLYNFLQVMDDEEELRYILAYFAKTNNLINTNEYAFNEENQIIFEGIMYQAMSLYSGKGFSKTKVIDTHKKFESEIAQKNEEKLSRTQELYTVKKQALKELGYSEINEKNASAVFQKIAEIQSRTL